MTKPTQLGVAIRHTKVNLPIPLEEKDKKAQEAYAIILEQSAKVRPFHDQIAILKNLAKPFEKKIGEALTTLENGKDKLTPVTLTIDHTNCHIKSVRDDTGEVVLDRKATEDELQADAFDK